MLTSRRRTAKNKDQQAKQRIGRTLGEKPGSGISLVLQLCTGGFNACPVGGDPMAWSALPPKGGSEARP